MCLIRRLHLGNSLKPALIPKLHFPESFPLCASLVRVQFWSPATLRRRVKRKPLLLGGECCYTHGKRSGPPWLLTSSWSPRPVGLSVWTCHPFGCSFRDLCFPWFYCRWCKSLSSLNPLLLPFMRTREAQKDGRVNRDRTWDREARQECVLDPVISGMKCWWWSLGPGFEAPVMWSKNWHLGVGTEKPFQMSSGRYWGGYVSQELETQE